MTNHKPAIVASNLSKSYKISHQLRRNDHPTLRDDLMHYARKPLEWIGAAGGKSREEFWALKEIDFEITKGDVVGIMGPNGSGKSTLFKILSRVTQPTTGQVKINGQTASLLEVGTGFHQELSGRENVYFNGAILGMKKSEIDKRFDEIVAFSEVERFIDTPVKFYSSGMKVRLAFSVAAHLKPEILIIDEVLAVGDVKFKQKSIKHMQEVAASGTTILFVSHIVSQIKKICQRGIVMNEGRIVLDSGLEDAVDKYLELNRPDEELTNQPKVVKGQSTEELAVERVDVEVSKVKATGVDISIDLDIFNLTREQYKNLGVAIMVADPFNRNVAQVDTRLLGSSLEFKSEQGKNIVINVKNTPLAPGEYKLRVNLFNKNDPSIVYHRIVDKLSFSIPDYEFGSYIMENINRNASSVLLDFDINENEAFRE